ncbi:MAG TPA: GNAT family N-acetyltransferase [Bradyrhizobium sp.]|nr:GNAT family N-acetyltransferase [Bradyrhizobium sp.]
MIAPLKPGVTLPQPSGPVIETARLILRQWRGGDVAPYTEMLADPDTARFITVDGQPVTEEMVGWRHTAVMAGHWTLHGAGMFAVEEKATGRFVGRVGAWTPPRWPGFEIGWGITKAAQRNGYGVEAARATIDWAFSTFAIDEIIHCIDRENIASQGVARRLKAEKAREIDLFGHVADVWVTQRSVWTAKPKA